MSRSRAVLFVASAVGFLSVMASHGAAAPGRPPTPAITAVAAPDAEGTVDAVDRALRTTVVLEGDGIYGAGILVDPPHGTVLTAWHVVEDMKDPRVTAYDGRVAPGQLLAKDTKLDLALLSVPGLRSPDLAPPRWGDAARLRPGEEVYAIGSPRRMAFTVSRGIVSYVGRPMEGLRYVQLDMAINDGNSGGPVVTKRGELVGIMSFILRRAQGLAFALPATIAAERFPQQIPTPSLAGLTRWLSR